MIRLSRFQHSPGHKSMPPLTFCGYRFRFVGGERSPVRGLSPPRPMRCNVRQRSFARRPVALLFVVRNRTLPGCRANAQGTLQVRSVALVAGRKV